MSGQLKMPGSNPGLIGASAQSPAPSRPQSQPSPTPSEFTTRAVDDPIAARNALYDGVLKAATSLPPVETATHRLELSDVRYQDDENTDYDRTAVKDAVLQRKSLGRRLRGTWNLIDNATNKPVDQLPQTLAVVPHVTEDGSIIHRGNRYVFSYQQRVRPGVYARAKRNGEYESFANAKQGSGVSHRYIMDPATGRFSINVGHSRVPLADLLEVVGVDNRQRFRRLVWTLDQTGADTYLTRATR